MDLHAILILGLLFFLRFLSWCIVIRVIISWVSPGTTNPLALFIIESSEQILGPIRKLLPRGEGALSMIDWSPVIALILLDLLRSLIIGYLS